MDGRGRDASKGFVLSKAIDFRAFLPGPKDPQLMQRYGVTSDHYVLMTFGRLAGPERKKGFDRVLEVLSNILEQRPQIRYLIIGQGSDRERLECKAKDLEVADAVIFTGYVDKTEIIDTIDVSRYENATDLSAFSRRSHH